MDEKLLSLLIDEYYIPSASESMSIIDPEKTEQASSEELEQYQ